MKCKVSYSNENNFIIKTIFVIDFVIQQSTGATAAAQLSNDKIEFIKKLGLNAKENMTFTSFLNDVNQTQ